MNTIRVIALAVLCTFLASCSSGWEGWQELYEPSSGNDSTNWNTQLHQVSAVDPAGADAPNFAASNLNAYLSDYRVGSGDRLRVSVFGETDLTGEYSVDGSGRISIPLLSLVEVGGRTTPEIESIIEDRLRSGFLRNPNVSVEVLTFRPFFVLGEVQTAGQYPYVNGMTVQNAIAIAGGYSTRASTGEVIVTRQTAGGPVTMRLAPTEALLPGDTIYVRERWF